MNIEIITTPNETLNETGFGKLQSCNNVLDALVNKGHFMTLTICKTVEDLENVVIRQPALVILAVKYIVQENGGKIWLSDYFEKSRINYSGSPRDVLMYDSNKVLAKSRLRKLGVNTADYFTALDGQFKNEKDLPFSFPLFLKPIDAANGNGIDDASLVIDFPSFEKKVTSLCNLFNAPVLVEKYLAGREFTVSIIDNNKTGELMMAAIEIVPHKSKGGIRILGAEVKKTDSEQLLPIPECNLKNRIKRLALDVFIKLEARDFGRIDIKTDNDGNCFFMEINLVPGMTFGSSYFPRAFELDQKEAYHEVMENILNTCLYRAPTLISAFNHVYKTKPHMIGPTIPGRL